MTEDTKNKKPRRDPLPLAEEDIRGAGAGDYSPARPKQKKTSLSFVKLFITITMAAPVAMVLALGAGDLYHQYSPIGKMPKATKADKIKKQIPKKEPEKKPVATGGIDAKKFASLIDSLEKSSKGVTAAIEKQTKAIEKQTQSIDRQGKELAKIASTKPQVIKGSAVSTGSTPKIIVVKVPSREKFDLNYELQKILTLSGVDLDDPLTSSKPFDAISSRDVLKEVLNSLNSIIAASRSHEEVGDFLKQNALTAKKFVQERLKQVR